MNNDTQRGEEFEVNSHEKAWVTVRTCCGPAGTKRKQQRLEKNILRQNLVI